MRLGVLDTGHPQWAIDLAPRAEELGFSRYWLGEHHGYAVQSGSPEVLTGVVAAVTERIRVGPAGVLLQFYSPYKVAESHRLLHTLYGPRIDLGVARGMGGSEAVAQALLDGRSRSVETYDAKVSELARLLNGGVLDDGSSLLETSGGDEPVSDFWVLGASLRTARLAAQLGASFGFSEYYAHMVDPSIDGARVVRTYRDAFQPSPSLASPRWNVAIAGAAVPAAARSVDTAPIAGPPPLVGTVARWRARLRDTEERYESDEIIVFDLCTRIADRRCSLSLFAEAAELSVMA